MTPVKDEQCKSPTFFRKAGKPSGMMGSVSQHSQRQQAFRRESGIRHYLQGRKRYQCQRQGRYYICGRFGHFARNCQHRSNAGKASRKQDQGEPRAPTLSTISSLSVTDSASAMEVAGRNSLPSVQELLSGLWPSFLLIKEHRTCNFIPRSWVDEHKCKTLGLLSHLEQSLKSSILCQTLSNAF